MKKKKPHKLLIAIIIEYFSVAVVTILIMLYQNSFGLRSLINGIQVSGALLFVIGWFVFINHHGLFDVVFYGVGAFLKSFVGKKMDKSLFEIRAARKPMPKYLFISMWVNAILIIGASYIIYFYYFS